jgi:hypothetical protein
MNGLPFKRVEDAWFWAMGRLKRPDIADTLARPCTPDDIVKMLDRLYRSRKITLEHARVLRTWGEQAKEPPRDVRDHTLWREAISRLEWPMRLRGVVQ